MIDGHGWVVVAAGGEAEARDGQASCGFAGEQREVRRATDRDEKRTRGRSQAEQGGDREEDQGAGEHVQEAGAGADPDQPPGPGGSFHTPLLCEIIYCRFSLVNE